MECLSELVFVNKYAICHKRGTRGDGPGGQE